MRFSCKFKHFHIVFYPSGRFRVFTKYLQEQQSLSDRANIAACFARIALITQHRLVVKYFNAAVRKIIKLICLLIYKLNYLMFAQLLRHYLKRGLRLICKMKFTALHYLAAYIIHNTKRQFANFRDKTKKKIKNY